MFKQKEYEMAMNFKNVTIDLLEKGNTIVEIATEYTALAAADPRHSINTLAMALCTVSLFGTDNGGRYWIPCTKDILTEYRRVRREISKGKYPEIYIFDYESIDAGEPVIVEKYRCTRVAA